MLASCCCCWKASAIPRSRMACSFSIVGCVSISSSWLLQGGRFARIEVFRAADVGMVERRLRRSSRLDGLAIQITFQNGFHALVGAGLERNGAARSGLQAQWGVRVAEPQNAQAGSIALFRVAFRRQNAVE